MTNPGTVYFVTSAPFPVGGAGTMRRMSLAKGLMASGYKTHIITTMNEGNGASGQVRYFDGIAYHCSGPKSIWGGSRISKFKHVVMGILNAAVFILHNTSKQNNNIITTNQYTLVRCILFWILAKFCGAYFITELNENPLVSRKTYSSLIDRLRKAQVFLSLRLYDDVYVMTYTLQTLLRQEYHLTKNVIVLHNTVDLERFSNMSLNHDTNVLFYAGSLSFRKDSVDVLLNALSLVKLDYNDIKLRVCCFSNDKYLGNFLKMVQDLQLEEQVELLKDVPNSRIPELMSQAHLLMLIRKPNSQTSYGFPTKLVEYLASGRPVIVSEVSDIPVFLQDRVSAYLIKDNTSYEIANTIRYALDNREQSDIIGKRGRLIAGEYFNNIKETKKIVNRHSEFLSKGLK